MSIKPSAAGEIRKLVDSLAAADTVTREAAIARLTVIGPRAVDRLLASFSAPETSRATRVVLLRVLESIGDARALPTVRAALLHGSDVAVAAAAALRPLLDAPAEETASSALDALVATALDRAVERRVRMAAYDALRDMPADIRDRVSDALHQDPDKTIAEHHTDVGRETAAEVLWQDALEGELPDNPASLREVLQSRAETAPLSALQKLVDAIRERERQIKEPARVEGWVAVRGALHQGLALRGSRIAVYDLRESIGAAGGALPATFLTALHLVGDESCLHPIAAAVKRAEGDQRWRHQLEDAFHAIVKREKLGRKSAAKLLSTTSRTTPRPTRKRRT